MINVPVKIRWFSLFTIFSMSSFSVLCQAQTGRVVLFEKGLMIQTSKPVTYTRYARSEFPYDPVGYGLITGVLAQPRAGVKPVGTETSWEDISAGADGYFKSERFNGGGLYLEYISPKEQVLVLHAAGHDKVYINGIPREGDHFDTDRVKIPVEMKKGKNSFYLTGGISNRIKAALFFPEKPVMLSTGFMTKPDLIQEEDGFKWASVTLMNSTRLPLTGLTLQCDVNGVASLETPVVRVEKMTSRRVIFKIPELTDVKTDTVAVALSLLNSSGKTISSVSFSLKNKSFSSVHERTFVSEIDGSVQYYSVIPGKIPPQNSAPALIMAVHGAGLEARDLAKVYDPKDWANLVLPTNRAAFGFAWEDWGRLDFLEVYEIGKKLFKHDPQKIYLTGHSMGGHASWYLGATYPDHWGAIGPCAGYPELHNWIGHHSPLESAGVKQTFVRAGNSQRTGLLNRNYLHHGIYINHGNADPVVSVEQARGMRSVLGKFHPDFAYYEYPGGSHWYGDLSADWPPLFDFLKTHRIPKTQEVRHLEFSTLNPGISSSSHWGTIYQQIQPLLLSSFNFDTSPDSAVLSGTTQNVNVFSLNLKLMALKYPATLYIDSQKMTIGEMTEVWLARKSDRTWVQVSESPDPAQKGPHRNGGFKDAFRHQMVFVYGTKGLKAENELLYAKARYDAETFAYRGNGSIEIIPDKDFSPEAYPDRNVILYGNAINNGAWEILLLKSPIQVLGNKIVVGEKEFSGDDLAVYFTVPRKDSQTASIGVVAGTGLDGLKATYGNSYFQAGTAFPDFTIFRSGASEKGYDSVEAAGWFGNDWKISL